MAKQFKPETLCVQAGWTPKKGEPRVLPIYQSTTFKYDTSEQMARLFDLEDPARKKLNPKSHEPCSHRLSRTRRNRLRLRPDPKIPSCHRDCICPVYKPHNDHMHKLAPQLHGPPLENDLPLHPLQQFARRIHAPSQSVLSPLLADADLEQG